MKQRKLAQNLIGRFVTDLHKAGFSEEDLVGAMADVAARIMKSHTEDSRAEKVRVYKGGGMGDDMEDRVTKGIDELMTGLGFKKGGDPNTFRRTSDDCDCPACTMRRSMFGKDEREDV